MNLAIVLILVNTAILMGIQHLVVVVMHLLVITLIVGFSLCGQMHTMASILRAA
jgi:hypothetical protein